MGKGGTRNLLGFLMASTVVSVPLPQLSWTACKLGSGVHYCDHHYNDCLGQLLNTVQEASVAKSTGTSSYKPTHDETEKRAHSVVCSGLSLERSSTPGPEHKARISGSPTYSPGQFV